MNKPGKWDHIWESKSYVLQKLKLTQIYFVALPLEALSMRGKNILFFDVYTLFLTAKKLHFLTFLKQHIFPFNIMSHTLVQKSYVFFKILPFSCWWSYQDLYKVLERQGRERYHSSYFAGDWIGANRGEGTQPKLYIKKKNYWKICIKPTA